VVPGNKGTLSRLLRAPNEFLGEELLQRRVEFCLWVSFPIGRYEKSRVILLAGIAPEKIFSIVKQKMPLSLAGELSLRTPVDQFDKIRIIWRLTRTNRQGWSEKQREQQ
jgi:hypothetical protein